MITIKRKKAEEYINFSILKDILSINVFLNL